MKLTFLGTRANLDISNRRHRRHSALLVDHQRRRIMIDCGADWLGKIETIEPDAVFVTHAHPDHTWGLADGAGCPVYATADAWAAMADYSIADRIEIAPKTPVSLEGGLVIEAFPVVHSLRAPAVGFRMSAGRTIVFYVPDVVDIVDRPAALHGVSLFIGDGSSLTRPLVRRQGDLLFGHTTVRAQLGWCREAGIPRALFTHCGGEIVKGDERTLGARVRAMGRERGIEARIAYDGLSMTLD